MVSFLYTSLVFSEVSPRPVVIQLRFKNIGSFVQLFSLLVRKYSFFQHGVSYFKKGLLVFEQMSK